MNLALAATGDDIKALMEQGKANEAYELGHASVDQYGNPAFDFFYGIAAIDSGHGGEGVLALERYLLSYPENRSARFHLARGYFVLGEDLRARDEFETLAADTSAPEAATIARFLDAIRARESRYNPSGSMYVELGIGFDSNMNAGLNSGATPSIPGLGNLPPLADNAASTKESGSATLFGIGGQGLYPVAPGITLYGAVGLDGQYHHKGNNDIFDQVNLGLGGGVSYIDGRSIYKAGLGIGQVSVDDQRYLFTTSLNGEWIHQYDPYNRFTLGAQLSRLSYDDTDVFPFKDKSVPMVPSANSIRTADFAGLTAGWAHVFVAPYQPVLSLSASYGQEDNRNNRPDLSRDVTGLRASLALSPAPKWGASVGLAWQDVQHQGNYLPVASSVERHDRYLGIDVGVSYLFDKNILLRADFTHGDQDSNIPLFEYKRDMISFKARYDFK